jgi:hypothetical protein
LPIIKRKPENALEKLRGKSIAIGPLDTLIGAHALLTQKQ